MHNLRDAMQRMYTGGSDTPDWAQRFDADTSQALLQHDASALIAAWPGVKRTGWRRASGTCAIA